jgi:hypothetical protein
MHGQVLDLDHCGDLGVKSAGQKQKAEFQLARGAVCALCFLASWSSLLLHYRLFLSCWL